MVKLTQEHVANYFMEQGCELLSNYEDSITKVKYRCICGNVSEIRFKDFKNGRRCGCGFKKSANVRKHDIEFIINYFKERGCVLLENEYLNTHQPMRYICECGQESKISFAAFKNRNPDSETNRLIRIKCKKLLANTLQAVLGK